MWTNWGRLLNSHAQEEKVDVVWTDPPYGASQPGGRSSSKAKYGFKEVEGDRLRDTELVKLIVDCLSPIPVREGSNLYICRSWHTERVLNSVLDELVKDGGAWAGLRQQGLIVWNKNNMGLCDWRKPRYRPKHEQVLWATIGPYFDWFGGNGQSDVWDIPRMRGPRPANHPTPKPPALPFRAIRNSCPEGGIVADPFAGSGPVLKAAEAAGVRARLMELCPEYCEYIVANYRDQGGDVKLLERISQERISQERTL